MDAEVRGRVDKLLTKSISKKETAALRMLPAFPISSLYSIVFFVEEVGYASSQTESQAA